MLGLEGVYRWGWKGQIAVKTRICVHWKLYSGLQNLCTDYLHGLRENHAQNPAKSPKNSTDDNNMVWLFFHVSVYVR